MIVSSPLTDTEVGGLLGMCVLPLSEIFFHFHAIFSQNFVKL